MEKEPKIERSDLSGKHDPKSVALKYKMLPERTQQVLDNALNIASFSFNHCFNAEFLTALTEKQREDLSSLNGDLHLEEISGPPTLATIQKIIKILKS